MILLLIILVVVAIILALVDGFVPARPSWLLNVAVILGFVALLIWMLTGADPITIDTK